MALMCIVMAVHSKWVRCGIWRVVLIWARALAEGGAKWVSGGDVGSEMRSAGTSCAWQCLVPQCACMLCQSMQPCYSQLRHATPAAAAADAEMTSDGFSERLAPRPRILVCAPSNAAIDELLERILR
jgi:hypothetical protein